MCRPFSSQRRLEIFRAVTENPATPPKELAASLGVSVSVIYTAIHEIKAGPKPTGEKPPRPQEPPRDRHRHRDKYQEAHPEAIPQPVPEAGYFPAFKPAHTPLPWPEDARPRFICQGDKWRCCLV